MHAAAVERCLSVGSPCRLWVSPSHASFGAVIHPRPYVNTTTTSLAHPKMSSVQGPKVQLMPFVLITTYYSAHQVLAKGESRAIKYQETKGRTERKSLKGNKPNTRSREFLMISIKWHMQHFQRQETCIKGERKIVKETRKIKSRKGKHHGLSRTSLPVHHQQNI